MLGYKELFAVTPEFIQYEEWPIKLVLVTPVIDLSTAQLASKYGIEVDIYKPIGWI